MVTTGKFTTKLQGDRDVALERQIVTVAEAAPQADMRFACVISVMVGHLEFVIHLFGRLDHPQRVIGGLCECATFGWNRCSTGSYHNMKVLIF